MSPRAKSKSPYIEIGEYLKAWRAEKFRSALAFFKDAKFDFSYSTYADVERGFVLPTPEMIVELARYFGKDEKPAILLWAQVQMPSRELRDLFKGMNSAGATTEVLRRTSDKIPDSDAVVAAPSFENTWVFGPREKQMLEKDPWLWELCLSLVMNFPSELRWEELMIPGSEENPRTRLEKILAPWISEGYLVASENGLRLGYQHLHLPRTPDWNEIRKNNVRRALESLLSKITPELIQSENAYRELIHRPLHPKQAERWIRQLKKLEADFKSDPYLYESGDSQHPTHALLMVLGPRPLKK